MSIKSGFAIWLTGLPASGKTTLAQTLRQSLMKRDVAVQILDSDELRNLLTPNPTYSEEERDWFYKVLIWITGLLTDNGVNVLIAATAHKQIYRHAARRRIASFAEVYLQCPAEACCARDTKGLWQRAVSGEINNLPGAGVPYEKPDFPEVRVDTVHCSAEVAAQEVLDQLDALSFPLTT